MPKGFMARTGKRNMDWRNDQAATLYYVEAIDAGNQKNKVDFRDSMAMESAFDQCFASAKNQTTLFWSYLEMQLPQLLLMNGTILEIQTYLFNPSDAAQNPK
jgi:hypothetical protein